MFKQVALSRTTLFRLFVIAILSQVAVFGFNRLQQRKYKPSQYSSTALVMYNEDTPGYFEPIDNFLDYGTYETNSIIAGHSKNGRAPYYGIIYGFFRLFLDKGSSCDSLAILQLVLKIISSIVFFKLAFLLTGKTRTAWIAFLLFCTLSWLSMYTSRLLTESFALSFMIFGMYYFLSWQESKIGWQFWLSAIFLGYAICLRPFLLPVIAVLVVWKLYKSESQVKYSTLAKRTIMFFIPLGVLLTPWVIRNYIVSEKLIVFQESVNAGADYSASEISLRHFLIATGENFMAWDYDAAGCWFDPHMSQFSRYEIPNSILCTSVTKYKLERARTLYAKKWETRLVEDDARADSMFTAMREGFISEKPFYYYLVAPMRITWKAFVHSGTELLHKETPLEYGYKILQGILFVLINLGAVIAVFWKQITMSRTLFIIPVVLAITLCFGFGFCERRYFIYVYPIFILYTSVVLEQLLTKFNAREQ